METLECKKMKDLDIVDPKQNNLPAATFALER